MVPADAGVSVLFSVLGPVRARRGQAELDLGPNQQRAILGLLLVRANRLVSIDDLIELLWAQDPPGSAVNVIHKYIGAIRRLLEPDLEARSGGRWLARQGAAYRLITSRRWTRSSSPPSRGRRTLLWSARSLRGSSRCSGRSRWMSR